MLKLLLSNRHQKEFLVLDMWFIEIQANRISISGYRIWTIFKVTGNSMSKTYGIEFVGFETQNLRKHTHTKTPENRLKFTKRNRKSRCKFDRSSPTYPFFEIQQLHANFRTKNNLAKGASGVVIWSCFAICLEAEGGGDGGGGGLSCKDGSSSWSIQQLLY